MTLPLCATFEDAGVVGGMVRMRAALATDCGDVFVALLPQWLWSMDFHSAVVECGRMQPAMTWEMIESLRTQTLRFEPKRTQTNANEPNRNDLNLSATQLTATARLVFGALLEAHAAYRAAAVCGVNEAPIDVSERRLLSRIFFDSYLAAVWTSAHAEYLGLIIDLVGTRQPTEAQVRDLMIPVPELYSVANLSNMLDVSALYERVASPRCCVKSSHALLSILARATNAGSRGWESTLHAACKDSDGAVRVCMQAIGVCFSALHPCVHPAARRNWSTRFVTLRAWRAQNQTIEFKELAKRAPGAIKEAVRLHLAAVFAADSATLAAFAYSHQPPGQLVLPPQCLPPSPMIAAMQSFAKAGAELALPSTRDSVAVLASRNLNSDSRSRKKPKSATTRSGRGGSGRGGAGRGGRAGRASRAGGSCQAIENLLYYTSWLGGRSGPASAAIRPIPTVVSGLLSASFRASYVPFWVHAQHHGHRAARLDAVQHAALHHNNPAYKLCSLLPLETFHRVQDVVMSTSSASLLTVRDACGLLSIACTSTQGGAASASTSVNRSIQEAEAAILSLSATDAATLIVFARMSSMRSQMLAYDLGAETHRMQFEAVCKRLLANSSTTPERNLKDRSGFLPDHATYLFVCSECKRVVNACQEFQGKNVAFNEVGLSASMLEITGSVRCGHMRCAKRSSAALRTAVSLEAAASALEVEKIALKSDPLLPPDLRPASIVETMCDTKKRRKRPAVVQVHHDDEEGGEGGEDGEDGESETRDSSSEVAKFRRDVKNSFEQHARAVSCGEVPLVKIPILGRVVRIFGDWVGICSFCGCLAKILPTSRFRGEICCMRCDFSMLVGKDDAEKMDSALPKEPPPACRFCGKVQPIVCTGAKWRRVEAPLDAIGKNAGVPPPLRSCFYCPTHFRAWMPTAHRSMSTSEIFSHLVQKARPMHGANASGSKETGSTSGTSTEPQRSIENGQDTTAKKAPTAQSKRKLMLTKKIAKNNRRNRLSTNVSH